MPRERKDAFVNSVRQPVFNTATYFFSSTEEVVAYHEGALPVGRYGRYDNPNWLSVERRFAALEAADEALLFPSGMSAIWTALMSFLGRGDTVAYFPHGYRNIRAICAEILPGLGITVLPLSMQSQDEFEHSLRALVPKAPKVVFLEAPTNPHQYIVDPLAVRRILDPSTILIVDSTFATPVNFKPMRHGADLVVHSASKYIGGHADLIAGLLAGRGELIDRIRLMRNKTGAIAAPEIASLLYRSLETLDLRMGHYNRTGLSVASQLEGMAGVARVLYTGLPSHPSHEQARTILTGHGGVVGFELEATREQTSRFVDSLHVPFMGTNFGGTQAMVEQCALFTYFKAAPAERRELGISDSFVRYALGLEQADEILEDIQQALTAAHLPTARMEPVLRRRAVIG